MQIPEQRRSSGPAANLRERIIKPMGRILASHPLWRRLFAPMYQGLVLTQMQTILLRDRLRRTAPQRDPLLDQLTLVIKTFERHTSLRRLVRSIRRMYPSVQLVIVDDSRQPRPIQGPGIDYVQLPFDSGVSAGRNAGVARVRTPYLMILDDDFLFFRRTQIVPALRRLAENPDVDLLGGIVITLPLLEWNDSSRNTIYRLPPPPPPGRMLAGLEMRHMVPNFFLARTRRVMQIGWDDRLKRLDHHDFFTRAYGVLRIVLDPSLLCLHAKTPFDSHYMQFRTAVDADIALLRSRYPGVPIAETGAMKTVA